MLNRLPILAASFLMAASTHGATIYGNRAAFLGAIGPSTTLNFEGLAPAGSTTYYGAAGLHANGIDITSSDGTLYAISATAPFSTSNNADLGSGDYIEGAYNSVCCGSGSTTFTLPAGTLAFGLDMRSYNQQTGVDGSTGSFQFDFNTTAGHIFTAAGGTGVYFFGYQADTPILSVTITPLGDNPNHTTYAQFLHFDNVTTSAAATPEPGTMALAGVALIAIGMVRRKVAASDVATFICDQAIH